MKIGILLPIGRLDKYGYQYNNDIVIKNLKSFADKIAIISSSRHNQAELFKNNPKIIYLSNETTWFEKHGDEEILSYEKLNENVNLGLILLKKEGVDAIIEIHINQYIPVSSWENIKRRIAKMIERKDYYEWLHKKYQCGEKLFNSDTKVPWILNVALPDNPYVFGADSIINTKNKKRIMIKKGNFKKFNSESIVDVFGEFTVEDAKCLYDFAWLKTMRLSDKKLSKIPPFDYSRWLNYYLNKFNNKILLEEPMDKTGLEILSRRKENFVSFDVENNYKPIKKNLFLKLYRYIKFVISK